jgi:hypothetical protein
MEDTNNSTFKKYLQMADAMYVTKKVDTLPKIRKDFRVDMAFVNVLRDFNYLIATEDDPKMYRWNPELVPNELLITLARDEVRKIRKASVDRVAARKAKKQELVELERKSDANKSSATEVNSASVTLGGDVADDVDDTSDQVTSPEITVDQALATLKANGGYVVYKTVTTQTQVV